MIEKTLNELLQKCKCNKRKVAAVIVDNNENIVGAGYNSNPNNEPCEDTSGNTKPEVIHAEINAINTANGNGIKMFVTHQPCPNCLAAINRAKLEVEVVDIFKKFDKDKLQVGLVPPEIIEHIASVLTYGAKKYSPNNWKKGSIERYLDASYRHLLSYQKGKWLDEESNLPHLAHLLANISFILYMEENK